MNRLVVVVVLLVAAAVRGHADDGAWLELKRGTRVRLMVEDGGPMRDVVGRLLASDPTTVTVDATGGPQRLARNGLFHLEYRTGGRDRKKGATIGAAITGLAGLVAGVVVVANEHKKNGRCDQCGIAVGFIAIAAAIPGGAIGFAIGTTGGDWHNVKPDGLTVTGAASPRRQASVVALRPGRRESDWTGVTNRRARNGGTQRSNAV